MTRRWILAVGIAVGMNGLWAMAAAAAGSEGAAVTLTNEQEIVRQILSRQLNQTLGDSYRQVATELQQRATERTAELARAINLDAAFQELEASGKSLTNNYAPQLNRLVNDVVDGLAQQVEPEGLREQVRAQLVVRVQASILTNAVPDRLNKLSLRDLNPDLQDLDDLSRKAYEEAKTATRARTLTAEEFLEEYRQAYRRVALDWLLSSIRMNWLGDTNGVAGRSGGGGSLPREVEEAARSNLNRVVDGMDAVLGRLVERAARELLADMKRRWASEHPGQPLTAEALETALLQRLKLKSDESERLASETLSGVSPPVAATDSRPPSAHGPGELAGTSRGAGTPAVTPTTTGGGGTSTRGTTLPEPQAPTSTATPARVARFAYVVQLRMKDRVSSDALISLHPWTPATSNAAVFRTPDQAMGTNLLPREVEVRVGGFSQEQIQDAARRIQNVLEGQEGINKCVVDAQVRATDPQSGRVPNVLVTYYLVTRNGVFGGTFADACEQAIRKAGEGFTGVARDYGGHMDENVGQSGFRFQSATSAN